MERNNCSDKRVFIQIVLKLVFICYMCFCAAFSSFIFIMYFGLSWPVETYWYDYMFYGICSFCACYLAITLVLLPFDGVLERIARIFNLPMCVLFSLLSTSLLYYIATPWDFGADSLDNLALSLLVLITLLSITTAQVAFVFYIRKLRNKKI